MRYSPDCCERVYEECETDDVDIEFKTLKTGFCTVFYRRTEKRDELVEGLGEKLGENEEKILVLLSKDATMSITSLA